MANVLAAVWSFNSRSRVGSDLPQALPPVKGHVSIHAPAWGATASHPFDGDPDDVSIHAPAWGATGGEVGEEVVVEVSIHAPAWGATDLRHQCPRRARVSIHAPAWGATQFDHNRRLGTKFQFTLPRGERLAGAIGGVAEVAVSIHAPAWGAT